jgi:hypothetical protein
VKFFFDVLIVMGFACWALINFTLCSTCILVLIFSHSTNECTIINKFFHYTLHKFHFKFKFGETDGFNSFSSLNNLITSFNNLDDLNR